MNTKGLYKRLTDPIEKFARLGDTTDTKHGPLTYIDRGSDVLAVAHLDWVKFNPKPKFTKQYNNLRVTNCPQLDDRLGAWMCLDVLPRAGIKCDVLLTDSEETANSTAQYFKPPKQYNWIMQFDRAGSDMVMYDYEDYELTNLMRSYDYVVGQGAYTDICYLYEHNCKGFNFGVGYHAQHTDGCYANLSETFDSFRKVQSFYKDHKDTHFEHEHVEKQQDLWTYNYSGSIGYYTPPRKQQFRVNSRPGTNFLPVMSDMEELQEELGYRSSRDMAWELDVTAKDIFGCEYQWLGDEQQEEVNDELRKDIDNLTEEKEYDSND